MYIVCLVVWGRLAVGFAAKCVAAARDSHYRIPVSIQKIVHLDSSRTKFPPPPLVFSRVVDGEGLGTSINIHRHRRRHTDTHTHIYTYLNEQHRSWPRMCTGTSC